MSMILYRQIFCYIHSAGHNNYFKNKGLYFPRIKKKADAMFTDLRIQLHVGMMVNVVIDAKLNFHLRNKNIMIVIDRNFFDV